MVFPRYVAVLRGAGKTLRCTLLEFEVNPKISLHRSTPNLRAYTNHAKSQPDISLNSDDVSDGASAIFHKNVPSLKAKIVELTSQAATGYDLKFGESDGFGKGNFISDDIVTENDLAESERIPGALDTCDRDISHITPFQEPSFNFAAYANDSPIIQELAKLGVELYKVEGMRNGMQILLRQSFEEIKPYIRFLHDTGVEANEIGAFITKNPYIFTQDMDDLRTRIRYLCAHNFNREMVTRIVSKNPYWLMFSTKRIDERLGFFQREFDLTGSEVRTVATKQPRLITYSMKHITENTFAFREEMGFNKCEVKALLLNKPRLLMKSRKKLVDVFDYVHNTMSLSHELLSKQPMILTCRIERLRQRHKYLEALGKNQYDPTKPLYVSPDAIVCGTDAEFCRHTANTTVETYNMYLKSL